MLRDKSVRMHEIGIEVFSPFTPMLGERAAPDQVETLLSLMSDEKYNFFKNYYLKLKILVHVYKN